MTTDDDHTYVDFVRDGLRGHGPARMGNACWRRLTEECAGSAKSVFHFDVQGCGEIHPCRSSLASLRASLSCEARAFLARHSVTAEAYPALWRCSFAHDGRNPDQHDAYCIAAWLSRADQDGSLAAFLKPDLTPPERAAAR
jgi:hypothetical protein